jgi:pimeloyl-ACP methyl ester carboxylesterase
MARADLTKYTTEIAMADLDEVRAALGYQRINLYGTSYGTYEAQVYLRDFPERVRSISMKGVVPLQQLAPRFHARDGEFAWRPLVARCEADERCRTTYPALDRDLRAILARLNNQPEKIMVKLDSGSPATITVSAGLFGELLRNMLYTPETQARVPALVRRLASADLSSLAPLALRTRTALSGSDLSAGFFLSVTCAEGVRAIGPEQIAALTRDTFAGDYRLQQQTRACDEWPRTTLSREQPHVSSEVPLLMLSGELDPVTPPNRAQEVLAHFARRTHVVAVNNGHPFGSLEGCGNLLVAQFVEKGSMDGIDASCARALPAVPFV